MYNKTDIFVKIVGAVFVLFIVLLFLNPVGDQLNVFYSKGKLPFNDFYNVMIYIADGDPYHNTLNGLAQKPYLPISYVIMDLFSGFWHFSGSRSQECLSHPSAVMGCLVFTLIMVSVFLHSIFALLKGSNLKLFMVVLFSYTFIFTIERGNLIFLTVSFVNYFLAYKDSDNKYLRWFAIFCISMAAVLKVFPAIFGLTLLKEKRYREIGFCVIFCLVVAFLPFLYFEHGFDNINQLFVNLQENTKLNTPSYAYPRYGFAPTSFLPMHFLGMTEISMDVVFMIMKVITWLLTVLSLLIFLKEKYSWKTFALISITLIMFPANSAIYNCLYIFPCLFMFLTKDYIEKFDNIYFILFIIILCPLQFQPVEKIALSVTYLLQNVAFAIIWILITSEFLISRFLSNQVGNKINL